MLGIDVSKHQGKIDWSKVKEDKQGIKFAMIRVGYGHSYDNPCVVDPWFKANMEEALAVGIDVGVYIYNYAKSTDAAITEAQFVLEQIAPYAGKIMYPISCDIEDNSLKKLSKSALTDIVNAFCTTIEQAGYYAAIYAGNNWCARMDMNVLAKYDLWLADWRKNPSKKYSYGMWQYTNKGGADGVYSQRLDMDIAYKDYPAIIKNNGLNGYGEKDPLEAENKKLKAEIQGLKKSLEYEQQESARLGGIIQKVRDVVA
jgi:GH25 family lysozyme M1 (1,4-beta-N-acetylmuramidase)